MVLVLQESDRKDHTKPLSQSPVRQRASPGSGVKDKPKVKQKSVESSKSEPTKTKDERESAGPSAEGRSHVKRFFLDKLLFILNHEVLNVNSVAV